MECMGICESASNCVKCALISYADCKVDIFLWTPTPSHFFNLIDILLGCIMNSMAYFPICLYQDFLKHFYSLFFSTETVKNDCLLF